MVVRRLLLLLLLWGEVLVKGGGGGDCQGQGGGDESGEGEGEGGEEHIWRFFGGVFWSLGLEFRVRLWGEERVGVVGDCLK